MSSVRRYTKEIYGRYQYLATWLPNVRVELGDVGVLEGASFKRMTSLGDLKISFRVRRGKTPMDFSQVSSSGVEVKTSAGASVGAGATELEASLNIEFAEEGAFLFRAKDCFVDEIGDRVGLGRTVLEAYGAQLWDAKWCIVDSVVRSASATIVVASSGRSSLSLGASTPLQLSNLADADANIAVTAQHGDVLHFVAAKGLTPLFTTIGIKQSWLSKLTGGGLTFGGAASNEEVVDETPGEDEDPFERQLPEL